MNCAIDVWLADKQAFLVHLKLAVALLYLGLLRYVRRYPAAELVFFDSGW